MFVLVVIKDTIRVGPETLDQNIDQALFDSIHSKYCNKVRFCT